MVNCLRLVVDFAISENSQNIVTKLLSVSVLAVTQLLLDCLEINGIFDHQMIVRNIVQRDRLSKRPRTLMLFHQLKNILTLEQERYFFCLYQFLVILPSPATFFDPWYLHRVYSEILVFALIIFTDERFSDHFLECFAIKFMIIDRQLFDFLNDKLFLSFDDLTNPWIIDSWMYVTLHHCSSFIVFDISFPSLWRHSAIFTKTLLPEIAQS